ncbi:hypothetical protein N7457_009037 [Penicillium paradoxum]|uniref:uncharacterized protein n=1 Tax=Penicillium paradoxum TaxID=176176 RepID=UPI002546CE8A|nr:uncharacterized protein N7457_009037 [Penicillium paradoxum]KAJ5774141.1 hypothetical protein N7457_009037 [Penicillium paradoxum]
MIAPQTGEPVIASEAGFVSSGVDPFIQPLAGLPTGNLAPQFYGPFRYGAFFYGLPYYPAQPTPSVGQLILGPSLPHPKFAMQPTFSTGYTAPVFPPASLPFHEPNDYPDKAKDCQIANRKYTNWLNTVYYSWQSPIAFVQAWDEAFKEMRQVFRRPHLPTIFVLNQFLTAVSANPNAIPWVQSLQFDVGSLPASILNEAYVDFLEFEAHRLSGGDFDISNENLEPLEPKQYCHFHQRPTRHSTEDCFRNPQNTKRKRRWRRKQELMATDIPVEQGGI